MKRKSALLLIVLIVLIGGFRVNVFAENLIDNDSEIIYDESIVGIIGENLSISEYETYGYEPCAGSHRHLSKVIYTGYQKLSNPPLWQVICYWCGGYAWIYKGPR